MADGRQDHPPVRRSCPGWQEPRALDPPGPAWPRATGARAWGRASGGNALAARRRLGSRFSLQELSDLYAGPTDWASEVARRAFAGTESSWIVDAAFGRYAREASDYRGGSRPRPRFAAGE